MFNNRINQLIPVGTGPFKQHIITCVQAAAEAGCRMKRGRDGHDEVKQVTTREMTSGTEHQKTAETRHSFE